MTYELIVKSKVSGETFSEGEVKTLEQAQERARFLEASMIGVRVEIVEVYERF